MTNRPSMRPPRRMHACPDDMPFLDSSGRRDSKRRNSKPDPILLDVSAPAWQVRACTRICKRQVTDQKTDCVLVAARTRRDIGSNRPS
jgi:hypothetical protein